MLKKNSSSLVQGEKLKFVQYKVFFFNFEELKIKVTSLACVKGFDLLMNL